MSKIVIVNGIAGAGKTTFEQFCQELRGETNCKILSTVTLVKSLASQLGWDGVKTPEARKFLSDLKDLLGHAPWANIPYEDIKKQIRIEEFKFEQFDMPTDKLIFFIDVREPEEIQRFVDEMGAITVLIRNPNAEKVAASNHADANVLNFKYDYVITNDYDLAKLKDKARVFLNLISY